MDLIALWWMETLEVLDPWRVALGLALVIAGPVALGLAVIRWNLDADGRFSGNVFFLASWAWLLLYSSVAMWLMRPF